MATLRVDGKRVEARAGESLLVAMLRASLHPTGGGCLCLGGDCPNCLVTVDGVAYTRSCQVKADAGMTVTRDHAGRGPALLSDQATWAGSAAPVHHVHCDTVIIGRGESGREAAREAREAGLDAVTLDAREGQHVTGVYPGPLVVAADGAGGCSTSTQGGRSSSPPAPRRSSPSFPAATWRDSSPRGQPRS